MLLLLSLIVLTDVSLLTRASEMVQQALWRTGLCDFKAQWLLLVTWHNVSDSNGNKLVRQTIIFNQY